MTRINARRATNPDARSQASNKVINRPGISLPFRSKLKLPVNMPPDQVEVFPPTKQPGNNMVINSEQMDEPVRSPLSPAACSSPKLPPTQAVLPCPSNGETKPPSKMVSKTVQQPIKKAVVSKRVTSASTCSPLLLTIPVPLTRSVPISSTRATVSRKAGKEPEPPVPVAAKRHTIKTSVVSTSPAGNKRTHGTIGGAQHPVIAEERAPKCSADARQLAPLQVRSSKFPGGMGEEQRAAYVANKIDKEEATHCLPKSTVVLTSPIPPSPQTPPIPSPEPSVVPTPLIPVESTSATETVAEQRANDVVSKDKTNVSKHSPEDSTPVPLSAHQTQTMPPCQDQDKASWPVKATPTRSSLRDIKIKKSKPLREDEGLYLSCMATYIRERMDRRSSAGDTFVPRARKDPPDKPLDSDARQYNQGIVSEHTMSVIARSQNDLATFAQPVSEPDSGLSSTSASPASPNNDLIVNKINCWPAPNSIHLPIVKTWEGEDEPLVEAARVRERSDEHFPKNSELVHRVPEDFRPPDAANVLQQWLGQEAISSEDSSIFLCSPESAVALAPLTPTLTLVDPPLAYSHLHTSLELEPRCKKPPDKEAGSGWLSYAVNGKTQPSTLGCSPLRWIAPMPSAIPPACKEWAETCRILNVELGWRAHCKPPNALDLVR